MRHVRQQDSCIAPDNTGKGFSLRPCDNAKADLRWFHKSSNTALVGWCLAASSPSIIYLSLLLYLPLDSTVSVGHDVTSADLPLTGYTLEFGPSAWRTQHNQRVISFFFVFISLVLSLSRRSTSWRSMCPITCAWRRGLRPSRCASARVSPATLSRSGSSHITTLEGGTECEWEWLSRTAEELRWPQRSSVKHRTGWIKQEGAVVVLVVVVKCVVVVIQMVWGRAILY